MKTLFLVSLAWLNFAAPAVTAEAFPGEHWETRPPEAVGLAKDKLHQLREMVGGRGCVVRHGYLVYSWGEASQSGDVASAFKPVLTTLMLIAVQEGRIPTVDSKVADFEPRLKTLNDGKDAAMTWRHLASQTSGYGLAEKPGRPFPTTTTRGFLLRHRMNQVYRKSGDEVLRTHLAEPLQFEDRYTFNAFGAEDRPGRLALSCGTSPALDCSTCAAASGATGSS